MCVCVCVCEGERVRGKNDRMSEREETNKMLICDCNLANTFFCKSVFITLNPIFQD